MTILDYLENAEKHLLQAKEHAKTLDSIDSEITKRQVRTMIAALSELTLRELKNAKNSCHPINRPQT